MTGSVYLLNRKVDGDQGDAFNQSVAVDASSPDEAKRLVKLEFARIRNGSRNDELPYHDKPEFDVDQIKLDEHKLLIHWITQ